MSYKKVKTGNLRDIVLFSGGEIRIFAEIQFGYVSEYA